jgi:membrane-associated phospholipid phosphatase
MLGYANEEAPSEDFMLWDRSRIAAVVVVIGLWAAVYFGTQKLTMGRARLLRPGRWDERVPEWEWPAFIYVLAYPYPLVLLVVVATDAAAVRVIAAFALLALSSGLLFLLFPTAIRRTREPRSFLLRAIYRLDRGGNCIPSLHGASALLTTCLLYYLEASHVWLGILCTLAISGAALSIRQHYLRDILAGYAVGLVIFFMVILI